MFKSKDISGNSSQVMVKGSNIMVNHQMSVPGKESHWEMVGYGLEARRDWVGQIMKAITLAGPKYC